MDRTDTFDIGTVLDGKYRIDGIIGEGGMGVVYEGTYLALNRKVAIKTLRSEYRNNGVILERFRQEARASGTIKHDNVCEVTDLGEDRNVPFLVMPLLEGSPLSELISQSQLSLLDLLDIVRQTLSALQAVHDAGIVHRDLKPDNIFLIKMGDRDNFVKLLDFGVSKFPVDDDAGLTRTRETLGTPYYMSPEQIAKSKTVDLRTDIYALGVILYEILTGRRPFLGDGYNEIIINISVGEFPKPSRLNPRITAEMENLVLTAMAQEPNDRFASAKQMRDQVDRLIQIPSNAAFRVPQAFLSKSNAVTTSDTCATVSDQFIDQCLEHQPGKTRRWMWGGLAATAVVFAMGIVMVLGNKDMQTDEPTTPNRVVLHGAVTMKPTGSKSAKTLLKMEAPKKRLNPIPDAGMHSVSKPTSIHVLDTSQKRSRSIPTKKKRMRNAVETQNTLRDTKPKKAPDSSVKKVISGKGGTLFFNDY